MANEVELERMVLRLLTDVKGYIQPLEEAVRKSKTAANTIKQYGAQIEKFGKSMVAAGRKMSLYITAPLAAIGGLATKEFADFQTSLTSMEALVGLSSETVAGFRTEIQKLAVEVGESPTKLADAMYFITSAGLRGSTALEALTYSARAADAGLGNTAVVADAVTSAMNAYGHEVLGASQATDVLVAAVKEGKAAASSFAPVLGQILPTANELGITFGEVGGILAFLTKSTGSASLAATGLRGIMTQLIRPTEVIRKKLPWLTDEFVKQSIATRGLHGTIMMLKKETTELGMPMSKLFSDIEGLNAALQLTGTMAGDAAKTIDAVTNSAGATDRAFQAAGKAIQKQWNVAMAQMKNNLIEIGEILSPFASKTISLTSTVMKVWGMLDSGLKGTIIVVAGVAAAAGPLLIVLGQLTIAASAFTGAIAAMQASLYLGPILILTAAIGAAVALYSIYRKKVETSADRVRDLIRQSRDLTDSYDKVVGRLQGLAAQQELTSEQMKHAGGYIEELKTKYGDLGISINKVTGEIEGLAEAQEKIDEQKARAALRKVESAMAIALKEKEKAEKSASYAMSGADWYDKSVVNWLHGVNKATKVYEEARAAYWEATGKLIKPIEEEVEEVVGMRSIEAGGTEKMPGPGALASAGAFEIWQDSSYYDPMINSLKEMNNQIARGQKLADEYATPFEKARKEIEDLGQLLSLLGEKEFGETYRRAIEKTMESYRQAMKEDKYVSPGVVTIRRGSVQEAVLKQEHRIAMAAGEKDVQNKQLTALEQLVVNTTPLPTSSPVVVSANLGGP